MCETLEGRVGEEGAGEMGVEGVYFERRHRTRHRVCICVCACIHVCVCVSWGLGVGVGVVGGDTGYIAR